MHPTRLVLVPSHSHASPNLLYIIQQLVSNVHNFPFILWANVVSGMVLRAARLLWWCPNSTFWSEPKPFPTHSIHTRQRGPRMIIYILASPLKVLLAYYADNNDNNSKVRTDFKSTLPSSRSERRVNFAIFVVRKPATTLSATFEIYPIIFRTRQQGRLVKGWRYRPQRPVWARFFRGVMMLYNLIFFEILAVFYDTSKETWVRILSGLWIQWL